MNSDAATVAAALAGIRILDLTDGIAGPLGVLLLAEHGADTIRVEPGGGSPGRRYEGDRCWGRSRRSVELDLESESGRSDFLRLATSADVVVESFQPGHLQRLGLGYDVLSRENPRLILVSCPAYPAGHHRSDRAPLDVLVQASSGLMWEQPGWRDGPIFLRLPVPSMAACFLVSVGTLAALAARERTGRGQHVETSLFDGALLYTTQIWQEVELADPAFHELMGKTYPPGIHQPTIYECAGGEWVHLSLRSGLTPVRPIDEILGVGVPADQDQNPVSPAEREALANRRRVGFRHGNRDELIDELRRNNHAVEAVLAPGECFHHPQTAANGMAATVVDPEVGPTTQIGVAIHLLGTPGRIVGPRPRVGEHTDEILSSLPHGGAGNARPMARPVEPQAALDEVRVLDFGQFLAGPFGPMVLGDLGADVIKVEAPSGDGMRRSGKPFVGCQRGKRSLAVDLKHPSGLEVAHRLIATSDVVHHNMTRGVAERLGIDYATCRGLRADVIYCNSYAYGLPDPLGRFGGIDPLFQASSGIEFDAGAVHAGNQPLYLRFGMVDTANAMLSVVGVLLALVHRRRTGEGQELWTSLHDGAMVMCSDVWLDADGVAWDLPRLDAGLHGVDALCRLYRTRGDGWICLAAEQRHHWEPLLAALDLASAGQDDRFRTAADRRRNREGLASALQAAFLTRTAREWTRILDEHGVPNEVPLDTHEGSVVLHDADNVRLGLVAEYEHPVLGRIRQLGQTVRLSETPGRIAGPPPLVGQHSRAILIELGYRDGDIDGMIGSGAVYEPDENYRDRFGN